MKFTRLTDYRNGKPLWIRDDQIAAWFFDRGHYHVMTVFDSVDIEVKETGEQILAAMEGRRNEVTPLTEATKYDTMLPKGGNQDERTNHKSRRPIRPTNSSQ